MPAQRTRDTATYSLEVITDGPQPPTLSILSPTPRAFTFPINDSDSPFSSPSCSPFDPDLRPLAISTTCTPPPTFFDTTSPTTSIDSASPAAQTPKRRKSSCSADLERRPKKGDEDYIKRPENAFILFRRKCCEDRQQAQAESADGPAKKQRQADLSKTISQQWKSLAPEERRHWEELAKEKKKEHEQLYPNYVYRPQRSHKDKDGRPKNKKAKGIRGDYEHDTDSEISFVLPFPNAPYTRRHGRSASAPTPPLPYQSIQLPNVYMPSCPTSPSLLPLIRRRAAHPAHQGGVVPFEYNLMPSAFGQGNGFEASLQANNLFADMYTSHGQQASRSFAPLNAIPDQPLPQSQSLLSPSSSVGTNSLPSSPVSGPSSPYSPSAAALSAAFPQLCLSDFAQFPNVGCLPSTEEEIQAELQLQHDLYSSFSWEQNSIWPSGGEMLLGEDFDLNAIPPIEIGLPKFGDDAHAMPLHAQQMPADFGHEFMQGLEAHQFHDTQQNVDGVFAFDEVLHGF